MTPGSLAVASLFPPATKAANAETPSTGRLSTSSPAGHAQSFAVPSIPAVTRRVPLGLKAAPKRMMCAREALGPRADSPHPRRARFVPTGRDEAFPVSAECHTGDEIPMPLQIVNLPTGCGVPDPGFPFLCITARRLRRQPAGRRG